MDDGGNFRQVYSDEFTVGFLAAYAGARVSSGMPVATIGPPPLPSMTQSADLMTSRFCSVTSREPYAGDEVSIA
jgi:hypothetical protein